MRIASLVPSATEALYALGLGDSVVAVTHECDHPAAATSLPRLTASVIPEGLPAGEIDARVRELTGRGEALYTLDEARLAELAPDLIVTQALCAVCAVSYEEVCSVAGRLPTSAEVISLDPETLGEVLGDLDRIGAAVGEPERGVRLRATLEARLGLVREAVAGLERPRVVALEWLDPIYVGGHWVPEMIESAGGIDVLGEAGRKSRVVEWEVVEAAAPDVVVVMPCGLYVEEAAAEARRHAARLRALDADRLFAVDAASSFSRPGPRLVEGTELLAHLFHPAAVEPPDDVAFAPVWASAAPSSRPR